MLRKLRLSRSEKPPLSKKPRYDKIDIVGFDHRRDLVVLVLLVNRPWDNDDKALFELQEKVNTYIGYVDLGKMAEDYPDLRGKKVEFRLQTAFPLRARDEEFIESVRREHLIPRNIEWKTERV